MDRTSSTIGTSIPAKTTIRRPTRLSFYGWVVALLFLGVENLVIRDVIIRNKRTFALLAANWRNVELHNIDLDTTEGGYQAYANQDGFHFWGPGQILTIRDVRGSSGDDFIALAPDENDLESSITDVLIDHVVLHDTDAGIRLLSRANGRQDRVIIRNITGIYKSFGFFINPYYPGNSGGHFGHIVFDTINLQHIEHNYVSGLKNALRMDGGHVRLLQADQLLCNALTETDRPVLYQSKTDSTVLDGLQEIP